MKDGVMFFHPRQFSAHKAQEIYFHSVERQRDSFSSYLRDTVDTAPFVAIDAKANSLLDSTHRVHNLYCATLTVPTYTVNNSFM